MSKIKVYERKEYTLLYKDWTLEYEESGALLEITKIQEPKREVKAVIISNLGDVYQSVSSGIIPEEIANLCYSFMEAIFKDIGEDQITYHREIPIVETKEDILKTDLMKRLKEEK